VDKLGNTEAYKDYAEQILGIDDLKNPAMAVRLVPNPARNIVSVRFVSFVQGDVNLCFYNGVGGKVFDSNTFSSNTGENDIAVDISMLAKGVYQVVLTTNEGQSTSKLIVW